MRRGAIALTAGLAFAGCGGGHDGPSRPLTKAEYIARADALCQDFHAHTPDQIRTSNYVELKQAAREVADKERRLRERIAELEPPPDGRAVHARLLEDLLRTVLLT